MSAQEKIEKLHKDAHDPEINPAILTGQKIIPILKNLNIPGINSGKILSTYQKDYDNNHDKSKYTDNDIYSANTEFELVTRTLKDTGFHLLKDRHTEILAEIVKNTSPETKAADPKFLEFAYVSAIATLFQELGIKESVPTMIMESAENKTVMTKYENLLRKIFGDYFIEKIVSQINTID